MHPGIFQLHLVEHHFFLYQIYTMAFQEETAQLSFHTHSLQQIGRIDRDITQGYMIHFHPAMQQRPRLNAHIQTAKVEQRIGSLYALPR